MAAYRTAYRLFPGCHLPLVYLAMEHTKLNNVTMAEQYLMLARGVCSFDPLVSNELGTLMYRTKQYVADVLPCFWLGWGCGVQLGLKAVLCYSTAANRYEVALEHFLDIIDVIQGLPPVCTPSIASVSGRSISFCWFLRVAAPGLSSDTAVVLGAYHVQHRQLLSQARVSVPVCSALLVADVSFHSFTCSCRQRFRRSKYKEAISAYEQCLSMHSKQVCLSTLCPLLCAVAASLRSMQVVACVMISPGTVCRRRHCQHWGLLGICWVT